MKRYQKILLTIAGFALLSASALMGVDSDDVLTEPLVVVDPTPVTPT